MKENQELVSFPFRPHLARYIFSLAKNEAIETEEAHYKHLDINMKSLDAKLIRLLMQRKDVPGAKHVDSKGFRLTVRIPKKCSNHTQLVEDSQTKSIWIDDETAEQIQDHFEARFRDHFIAFVSGAVYGTQGNRNSRKKAIIYFMETYGMLEPGSLYTFDQMAKLYERRNTPLKQNIYKKEA